MKLSKGTLKIVVPNRLAAKSNAMRARAGSARLKPVYRIYVLNGGQFDMHEAFDFRASSLAARHEPLGIRHAHPFANSAMRRALEDGVWFETRSEITLVTEQGAPAETTEESTDNG